MSDDWPGTERITIKRTTIKESVVQRPPHSARLGCALFVMFLVLGAATFLLVWLEMGIFVSLLNVSPDQWEPYLKSFLNGQVTQVMTYLVVIVLGAAIGLPLAAYFEAEEFLVWLKRP